MNLLRRGAGLLFIWIIVLAPIIIWASMLPVSARFADYAASTRSLGQLAALVGTTLFALTFVLTTRLRGVEFLFTGLDKVYVNHHLLGAISFILLLFHPILLVLNLIPENMRVAALFFVPDNYWPINFGIIALTTMIILLVLTFFVRMKYLHWRISHKFLGIVFIVAIFHFFMVDTDISRSITLKWFMVGISAIAITSHIYSSYLKSLFLKPLLYEISSLSVNGPFTTLSLKPRSFSLRYKAGQFVFPGTSPWTWW